MQGQRSGQHHRFLLSHKLSKLSLIIPRMFPAIQGRRNNPPLFIFFICVTSSAPHVPEAADQPYIILPALTLARTSQDIKNGLATCSPPDLSIQPRPSATRECSPFCLVQTVQTLQRPNQREPRRLIGYLPCDCSS